MQTRDASIMLSYAKDIAVARPAMQPDDILDLANTFCRWLEPPAVVLYKALHDQGLNKSELEQAKISESIIMHNWREAHCDIKVFAESIESLVKARLGNE